MTWSDKFSVRGCPRHRGYHPTQGNGAIRAGCERCLDIYLLYLEWLDLRRDIKRLNDSAAVRRKP
jgi:hypothetical protein